METREILVLGKTRTVEFITIRILVPILYDINRLNSCCN